MQHTSWQINYVNALSFNSPAFITIMNAYGLILLLEKKFSWLLERGVHRASLFKIKATKRRANILGSEFPTSI